MTAETMPSALAGLTGERDRLRARLDELTAGRDEIAALTAMARQRIDAARKERDDLARAAGGSQVSYGNTTPDDPAESMWLFSHPYSESADVKLAAERVHVVRAEARPLKEAAAQVDAALRATRAALDQAEAGLAAQERDRAERLEAWTRATTERHLPPWQERAEAVLTRLGLGGG